MKISMYLYFTFTENFKETSWEIVLFNIFLNFTSSQQYINQAVDKTVEDENVHLRLKNWIRSTCYLLGNKKSMLVKFPTYYCNKLEHSFSTIAKVSFQNTVG